MSFFRKISAWLAVIGLGLPGTGAAESLESMLEGAEETFQVFPTYAAPKPDGDLIVPVRAWVFEPEEESSSRAALVGALKSTLDIENPEESELFEERIWPFLVDNERGKTVHMVVGDKRYRIGESAPDGHTTRRVRVDTEYLESAVEKKDSRRYLNVTFEAEFGEEIERTIPVVEREGVSVISDIDDTIKVTDVLDTDAMLKNTFLRDFEAVDGMADLYQKIASRDGGADFHYLSASPWQLLPFLSDFADSAGFPNGPYHLRQLRPKSFSSPADFVGGSEDYKRETIEQVMSDFPDRTFVLIGDSGEHDPEIYGQVARNRTDQVAGILIRQVEGAKNSETRFGKAFRQLPDELWLTTDDPKSVDVDNLVEK